MKLPASIEKFFSSFRGAFFVCQKIFLGEKLFCDIIFQKIFGEVKKFMQTKVLQPTQENLKLAGELIRAGELVAFPTETVYGLGADGLNFSARQKIYAAKGRPSDKPLSLHVASLEQVAQVAEISQAAEKLFKKFCPGPLTIILPRKKNLPDFVTGGLDSVGIRFPDNEICLELIKIADKPIAASSANLSDFPPPKTAQEVFQNLRGKIEIILDGGACKFGISSTVLDITAEPKILRRGSISEAEILLALK